MKAHLDFLLSRACLHYLGWAGSEQLQGHLKIGSGRLASLFAVSVQGLLVKIGAAFLIGFMEFKSLGSDSLGSRADCAWIRCFLLGVSRVHDHLGAEG